MGDVSQPSARSGPGQQARGWRALGCPVASGDDGSPRGHRIARGVCRREEFNALRERLPRSIRRDVEPVPPGHVGLLVQALAGEDYLVLSLYGHVRADADLSGALAALERRLLAQLR